MAVPSVDPRQNLAPGLESASEGWVTIAPNDSNDLAFWPIAIEVGATAGTVVMQDKSGNNCTFYFNAGQQKALRPARILATGTTATPIIALK